MMRAAAVVGIAAVAALAAACDGDAGRRARPALDAPYVPASAAEAGPVLLSVDNATPWDEIAGALEPNFKAESGESFLTSVFPATALIQDQMLNALGLGVGIGLPRSTREAVRTTDTAAGSETRRETETRGPGTVPTPPTGTPAGGSFPGPPSTGAAALGIDPLLKYQAAASLFQAVRLMNAEVRNVALRAGYLPYLVRLKLAPLPYRPDLDVDVYAKVAFFHAHMGEGRPPAALPGTAGGGNERICRDRTWPPAASGAAAADGGTGTPDVFKFMDAVKKRPPTPTQGRLPYVLPVLVTDNMERAVQARAAEIARQLGVAVNFMVSNVGGALGFNAQDRRGQTFTASDFNSLLTVTRLSDNTLFVRLGAMGQAPTGRALQARTYDVSVLLLVPCEYWPAPAAKDAAGFRPKLSVITQVELRSAHDGAPIGPGAAGADAAFFAQAEAAIALFVERAVSPAAAARRAAAADETAAARKRRQAEDLRRSVQSSDFAGFFRTAWEIAQDAAPAGPDPEAALVEAYAKSLWVLISRADTATGLRSASVELRPIRMPAVERQLVLLRDDGSRTWATLAAASHFAPGRVAAFLHLVPKGKSAADVVPLAAEAMTADPAARSVRFEFPSLAALGLGEFEAAKSRLSLRAPGCPRVSACDFGEASAFVAGTGEARLPVVYLKIAPSAGGAGGDAERARARPAGP